MKPEENNEPMEVSKLSSLPEENMDAQRGIDGSNSDTQIILYSPPSNNQEMGFNISDDHQKKPKTKRKHDKGKSTKNQGGLLPNDSIPKVVTENPLNRKSKNGQNLSFRCNLGPMLTLVNDLHNLIRREHLEVLTRTPFGNIFMAFYEKKLNRKEVTKTTTNVLMVMNTYCPKEDAFLLGGKLVKLTVDDVALTFGLPKRGKKIIPQPRSIVSEMESEFIRRQFHGVEKLNKAAIMTAIKKTIHIKERIMEEDFARLVVLYMAVTIFFPNSLGSIGWSFIQHIEDLEKMNKISWSAVVHEHLMKQVRKHHKEPIKAAGCVIQLLFWLCEHVNLIPPIQGFESALPRVARWNLNDLSRALKIESLESLPKEKISINLKNISQDEMKLLAVEVPEAVEVQKEEISRMEILAKENEKLKDENLHLKKMIGQLEIELERLGGGRNDNTRETCQGKEDQDDENLIKEIREDQKIVADNGVQILEECEKIIEMEKEMSAITNLEDNNRVKRKLSEYESNVAPKKSKKNKADKACQNIDKDSVPLEEIMTDDVQEETQPEVPVNTCNLPSPKTKTDRMAHISEEQGQNIEKSMFEELMNLSPDFHPKIEELKEGHLKISMIGFEEHIETTLDASSTAFPESDPAAADVNITEAEGKEMAR